MTDPSPPRRLSCQTAIIGLAVGLALLVGALWFWHRHRVEAALVAQEAAAEEAFGPAIAAMKKPAEAPDIDTTVRVIQEIDMAVQHADSLDAWLAQMARQDYRRVDPEVLEARSEVLDILKELYAKQTELEDQQALWEVSSGLLLLGALSVVDVEGKVDPLSPSGSVSVDRAQAQSLLEELLARQKEQAKVQKEVRASESRLLDALTRWSTVQYAHLERWDRLCTLRDRAYLAIGKGDWATAREASAAAIEMAPHEREAHLLQALALMEGGANPEGAGQALVLLSAYVDEHPSETAPAFLLMGVAEASQGNLDAARLHLEQSAAYYPRQATELTDMLDPYQQRAFLRKSREGRAIIEQYKDTMLGAGAFSPDLQLARLAFLQGNRDEGRKRVMDHFSRRRSQQQWDFLLADLEFCEGLLGTDYRKIFPEDVWLDLVVKPTMLGSKLDVSVRNRSDRSLHNATLVLALQLTDMHPDDYETFVAGVTQPAVVAHETTSFGTTEIKMSLWGQPKTVDDIVSTRAILVTNEAVVWVDTDAFRLAEATDERQARRAAAAEAPVAARSSRTDPLVQRALKEVRTRSTLHITKDLMKDDVTVTLPRELVLLRPLLRLRSGDDLQVAEENLIVGEDIKLTFKDVGEFSPDADSDLSLVADTPYGDLELSWRVRGDGTATLMDVAFTP